MEIRPLEDRVLIALIEPEQKVGKLWTPKPELTKCERGKVLAVGAGAPSRKAPGGRLPMELKRGDVVWFTPVGGHWKMDEGRCWTVREKYIFAKEEG